MAFVADKQRSRFTPDTPSSRFTPDAQPVQNASQNSSPAKRSFKDRLIDAGGGPMFMAGGGTNPEDSMSLAGQIAGSIGGPAGSVTGAAIGSAGRKLVKIGRGEEEFKPRSLAFSPDVAAETAVTAAFEGGGNAIGKAIPKAANRMMLSVLKPGREVIKKNPNLGLDALEAGITGSREGMISKSDDLIKHYESEISKLIKGNNKRINAESIISALDDAKATAVKGLKPEDAKAIETVKQNFLNQLPKKDVVNESSFVMGPASKQVSPQITSVKGSKVSNKVAPSEFNEIWGEYKPEVVTPKKFVENPEDIVSLHNPGEGANTRKLTTISPKETYAIRPETQGNITKKVTSETDMLGMNLEKGQAMKKAIYSETPDSAFNRALTENPGATEGRRTVASGLRKEIGAAEPKTMPLLKKESSAIQIKKALENSFANAQKTVILPKLAGMGAGGLTLAGNPIAGAGVLAGDMAFDFMRSAPMVTGAAKNLTRARKLGKPIVVTASEAGRRIFN